MEKRLTFGHFAHKCPGKVTICVIPVANIWSILSRGGKDNYTVSTVIIKWRTIGPECIIYRSAIHPVPIKIYNIQIYPMPNFKYTTYVCDTVSNNPTISLHS